ncbi:F-box/LRR-repeat protein fbxl-1 [Tribolium castaneum]|uniref:F-box domain-containing protein n=1 Tax=Tribolium castaneum TaxID=7070 RepID=D7EIU1_TRICA|nr:PREDICTED: uncharacterized F-box/LRR-repeat protein C02F5.7 [Tribolium castaneum]EFA12376.2 hypothetical protein TcasGA2_TC002082 [Tribolium castaneum]|eukprot:XP_008199870.1 PREDICTED: uncharacterized F-box/LRR-repeat protein C02F5.7 [Tribolium castaneum]
MEQENQHTEGPPRKKSRRLVGHDLTSLPYDILVNIFKHLDLKTIGVCATLCSTFNNVSKDSSLYQKVTLKYNMNKEFLESFVSKISYPKELCIEYKYFDNHSDNEDYSEFDKYVRIALTKCGEHVQSLKIDSCRSDDILLLLSECTNLKELTLYRCKSSFQTLTSISTLKTIKCISCHFPQKIASEVIKNNHALRKLHLSDNTNVNVNEICENLSRSNEQMRDIFFSERKKLRAKSLRTLGRLAKLRSLALVSGTGFECDPEDSLEQIAAGCSKLERLVIYGWKEINDDNLIPILHMCTQLRELDLRGLNITIRSCREAALSLPSLRLMDVIKCHRVKKSQLAKLKQDFSEIDIPLE